jgi:hypothetical protein
MNIIYLKSASYHTVRQSRQNVFLACAEPVEVFAHHWNIEMVGN